MNGQRNIEHNENGRVHTLSRIDDQMARVETNTVEIS